jgi:UPF0042 nucleotide-binding protein
MMSSNADKPFIVLGSAASGISLALDAFAEYGYTTLNVELTELSSSVLQALLAKSRNVAIAPKVSAEKSPQEIAEALLQLKAEVADLQVLILNAPNETLIKRYLDSGKPHPFEAQAGGLEAAVGIEKMWLATLRDNFAQKDYAIDTSTTTPTELRLKIARVLKRPVDNQQFTVYITTFGFKYGPPSDAELMFDMRFMTNPFNDENLRHLTGQDQAIKDYLFGLPHIPEFFERWSVLVASLLPYYRSEGKTRLSVAIGCTGGKHRSVCMGESLAEYLQKVCPDYKIVLSHRETQRWHSEPSSAPVACTPVK